MRSQCVPATQSCGPLLITNDSREVYTVTCGSVIVATPPTLGVGATPYRTVYIVLPQTSRPPTPLGQQVTILNGSSVSAPLHIIVMGIEGGRSSARTLAELGTYTVTMRTPQLGPNFTGTFYYAGYRWLQSLSPTPYADSNSFSQVPQFLLLDETNSSKYYGIVSFEFVGPGVAAQPTSVTVSTTSLENGAPATPLQFNTYALDTGATTTAKQTIYFSTNVIPAWTSGANCADYPGTAYVLTSPPPNTGTPVPVPIVIDCNSSQYYFGVKITKSAGPPTPTPGSSSVYFTACYNAIPRHKITTDLETYVSNLAVSAFGANPISGGLTVNVTSAATAQLTFPYVIQPSTGTTFNVPNLAGKTSLNGFAILFDGTGSFTNSLNYVFPNGHENVISQSVVFGDATLCIILFTGEYSSINFTLRDYLTPQLGTSNAVNGINFQDFGNFTGALGTAAGSLGGFRLPGIAAATPFAACPITTQTLGGVINYFVTVPQANFLVFPGGLLLNSSAPTGMTYSNLLPVVPTGYTVAPNGKLLSIAALTNTSTPSLLTDGVINVKLNGMNRPGTEWSPIGWYLFEASGSLVALKNQLTTINSTGVLSSANMSTAAGYAAPYEYITNTAGAYTGITGWDGWCCNTLRIPLNQQFWLDSVTINGTPQIPNFSFTAGQYNYYYKRLVEQIILVGRKVGIEYFILDLHWSDCGNINASHVQSPNGLPCSPNFGDQNGIYGNIGQQMLPDTNSVAFWADVAQFFDTTNYPDVLFELYNEPFPFQDPNSTGPNNLTPYDLDTNGNQIWTTWLNGPVGGTFPPLGTLVPPGLPTRPLYKPDGTCNDGSAPLINVPLGQYTFSNTFPYSVNVTTPGYVGMQNLLDVVHTISPDRVCIVGGVQFSYRLDGIFVTENYQYALKNLTRTFNAANVLYNAHPYTSQLFPDVRNYADFENAFGMVPNYTDMICTEYGNNQGTLVGNTGSACDGAIQQSIQDFIDGKTVTSVNPDGTTSQVSLTRSIGGNTPVPYAANITAWAWHAGYCDFPSMIGTNVYAVTSSNVYDYVAFETGTSVSWTPVPNPPPNTAPTGTAGPGGVPCMGQPILTSLQERAGQTPVQIGPCTGCPKTPA
jgi:hypothetical protein